MMQYGYLLTLHSELVWKIFEHQQIQPFVIPGCQELYDNHKIPNFVTKQPKLKKTSNFDLIEL